MKTLDVQHNENDDPAFMDQCSKIFTSISKQYKRKEIYLIKIDNWFGEKWLGFHGKAMGVLGVRSKVGKSKLVVPPFNPNRVISEERFCRDEKTGKFSSISIERKIHKKQEGWKNLKRFIETISDSAVFIWYSGNTLKNAMGSLLVYVKSEEDVNDGWYVCFEKKGTDWKIRDTLGITAQLIEKML